MKEIIYGIVQGLTEFLPVSSSGHLVLVQALFNDHPPLAFDVLVHLATLLATFVVFRKEITSLFHGSSQIFKDKNFLSPMKKKETKTIFLMLISTVITGIIGLALKSSVEKAFSNVTFVALALIMTGTYLYYASQKRSYRTMEDLKILDAVFIGLFQGIAVMPGISRSGMCIATGLILGWERRLVGQYAFIISIPAILGAFVLTAKDLFGAKLNWLFTSLGFISAFVVGYVCLRLLITWIEKGKLSFFVYYCWAVGFVTLLVQFFLR